MSASPKPPSSHRFSRQGFQPLNNSMSKDATIDIPLEPVPDQPLPKTRSEKSYADNHNEKSGLFHLHGSHGGHEIRGRRKVSANNEEPDRPEEDEENDTLTRMGRIYFKILHFSIVTRYFIYVLPLAVILAVPIIVGATVATDARIGNEWDHSVKPPKQTARGVQLVWFFTWLEIVWLSLWVSKIVAHFLPVIFQFFVGVISSGIRKYALLIRAVEIPLSLVGWALCSLATFYPLMKLNADIVHWMEIVQLLLSASVASACVFLAERVLIQLISINYHRKQFNNKIKESKRNIYLLGLLYDASRTLFPAYCEEFAQEDYIISDSLNLSFGGKKNVHKRSGSATPMRVLNQVGRVGDKLTSVFGNVAKEITGKQVFDPESAHSVVVEALEKIRSSEALARRLWMSFVVEGKNSLYQEDIIEVLGSGRKQEAEECFASLDRDGNGDISLDEMILTVTEFGRERKSIATSMHDVDQAIHVLDGLLSTVVLVICVFIFIAFLNENFVTTLATAGTALLSLSFVFAVTCQEVLGSCIFLFVKHPYDIGDRVDIGQDQLTVEHISLLFTVFKRVNTNKMVQIPNIVLNGLWIENVSRSKAMREQLSLYIHFDTSFEDIKALKSEMQKFVLDKENCRDFQPDVDIEVTGIAEMNKLELRIEIRHKSNWANDTVRAMRRSKFMCALVLALRKVPIYAPGGGDAILGDWGKPTYSVAISEEQAQSGREKFATDKEAKRMFPSKKAGDESEKGAGNKNDEARSSAIDFLGGATEGQAIGGLISRPIALDPTRDDTWTSRDDVSSLGGRRSTDRRNSDRPDIDEVRGLLQKAGSKGKRKQDYGPAPIIPAIAESPLSTPMISSQDYVQGPQQQSTAYLTYTPNPAPQTTPPIPAYPQAQSQATVPMYSTGVTATPGRHSPPGRGEEWGPAPVQTQVPQQMQGKPPLSPRVPGNAFNQQTWKA